MTTPWLICTHPRPEASRRLFCFPYAGAGASIFRTWGSSLPPDIEVYAIQLPGRERRLREPLCTRLPPLIETLAAELLPYCDRPFAFFGHSLGALISFELARYCDRHQAPMPDHLLVSGRRAPQFPPALAPIHALPEPEFLQELRRYNGTPESVLQCRELMDFLIPILRADLGLDETYDYQDQGQLPCKISAFGGRVDPLVSPTGLAGWQQQTQNTFNLQLFEGDHFYLKPQESALLNAIAHELELYHLADTYTAR